MDLLILQQLLIASLISGGIYAMMALGLTLIYGILKVVNLAHGEFFMIGAYTAFWLLTLFQLDPIICILSAGLVGFLLGMFVEEAIIRSLRSTGREEWLMNSFVMTLGLSMIIQNVALNVWGSYTKGVQHYWTGIISVFGIDFSIERIIIICLSIVINVIFWFFLQKTTLGKAIRATSQKSEIAEVLGINTNFIYMLGVGLSGMLASFSGALLLGAGVSVRPTSGGLPLLKGFTVLVLGGLGNINGSIFAAFLFAVSETFVGYYFLHGWSNVFSVVAVAIILILKPYGLFKE